VGERAAYDEIGRDYAVHRRADPRILARLLDAVGDARTVLDVGSGTGSYEPSGRSVVAVEPSMVMISQRARNGAPAVGGRAEALPFADDSFDAAIAVLTVHHWSDPRQGLAEMCRVAHRRVVLTFDVAVHNDFWLLREYLPAAAALESARGCSVESVAAEIGASRVEIVPVPHDCVDGFGWAYWRRPDRYLDQRVRSCISMLAALDERDLSPGLARLAADLGSGAWHARHRDLLELDEIDGGFRLVIAG
jgi:SAM-dependent methyltransferase